MNRRAGFGRRPHLQIRLARRSRLAERERTARGNHDVDCGSAHRDGPGDQRAGGIVDGDLVRRAGHGGIRAVDDEMHDRRGRRAIAMTGAPEHKTECS